VKIFSKYIRIHIEKLTPLTGSVKKFEQREAQKMTQELWGFPAHNTHKHSVALGGKV